VKTCLTLGGFPDWAAGTRASERKASPREVACGNCTGLHDRLNLTWHHN
jgi:hypothetical protein